jgi:hypothetical protein
MNKKSFRPRFIYILTLFGLCFLLNAPVHAQKDTLTAEMLAESYNAYKTAKKEPCGKRDEAIRIGRELVEKFKDADFRDPYNPVVEFVKKDTARIEAEDKACKEENSLANLYEKYKAAKKSSCGERGEAIRIGKQIIELYGDDADNPAVVEFIRKDIPKIEEQERICKRNARYDQNYKAKNWRGFFAVSKEIIDEEGDSRLALDVMLTFVSVGLNVTAYEKTNAYNSDTVTYAKKAIELIESGVRTQRSWGIYEPYETKTKALGWLNYTIAYISYFRLRENKKAIPYFYRAAQYDMEFKNDAFVYQAIAIYYFDKEAVMASSLAVNDFITKANTAANPFDDGFGVTAKETAKQNERVVLYKKLVDLYNMRYNLEPTENVNDLADYIQKIINRPLIDPSAKIYRRKTVQAQNTTQE